MSVRWLCLLLAPPGLAAAADPLTFDQVLARYRANNPALEAARIGIQENVANEVTASLRPNPVVTLSTDQYQFFRSSPYRPFEQTQFTPSVTQLWERRNKRGLRTESARLATAISRTDTEDLDRSQVFNLRDAFNRTLLAKSLLELAQENLAYYDKVISVNRSRLEAGDVSKLDFQRIELQRVQFESDLQNAEVNLRTSKIQLLALMNERTPLDNFDVSGKFEFEDRILLLDELRQAAVAARPDLQSATTTVTKAQVDNRLAWANGSVDPTLGMDYQHQRGGPYNYAGWNVSMPLRIFDRNQGEKARTALEITRSERLRDSLLSTIYRDVDSAYAALDGSRRLLRSYRDKYLAEAAESRDLVSFAYTNGGASLLEFLDAQKSYRDTQLAYRNLIGSYLAAAAQLNLAVGQEVIR